MICASASQELLRRSVVSTVSSGLTIVGAQASTSRVISESIVDGGGPVTGLEIARSRARSLVRAQDGGDHP